MFHVSVQHMIMIQRTCKSLHTVVTKMALLATSLHCTLDFFISNACINRTLCSSFYESIRGFDFPSYFQIDVVKNYTERDVKTSRCISTASEHNFESRTLFHAELALVNMKTCHYSTDVINCMWQGHKLRRLLFDYARYYSTNVIDLKFGIRFASHMNNLPYWDFEEEFSTRSFQSLGMREFSALYGEDASPATTVKTFVQAAAEVYPLSFGQLLLLEVEVINVIKDHTLELCKRDNPCGMFRNVVESNFSENKNEGFAVTLALTEELASHYVNFDAQHDFPSISWGDHIGYLEHRTCDRMPYYPDPSRLSSFVSYAHCFDNMDQPRGMDDEAWMFVRQSALLYFHDGSRIIPVCMSKEDYLLLTCAFKEFAASSGVSILKLKQIGVNLVVDMILKSPFTISMKINEPGSQVHNHIRSFTIFVADCVNVRDVITGNNPYYNKIRGENLKVVCCHGPLRKNVQQQNLDHLFDDSSDDDAEHNDHEGGD